MSQCLPGYDEDAALAAALEGSRVEALQHLVPQRQSIPALEDDESFAHAIQESLKFEHQDRALAYPGKAQPAQVCMGNSKTLIASWVTSAVQPLPTLITLIPIRKLSDMWECATSTAFMLLQSHDLIRPSICSGLHTLQERARTQGKMRCWRASCRKR